MSRYQKIICIHPQDETTSFLTPIREVFGKNTILIEPNIESHDSVLKELSQLSQKCLIVFLGHGSSILLKGAVSAGFELEGFIDNNQAKTLFANHDVFLLSCNSSEFLKSFSSYNASIGFGNILSSIEEVEIEQKFRDINVDAEDIEIFKFAFVKAIYNSFLAFNHGIIKFSELSICIRYNVNKEINIILLNKGTVNRKEVAKLLFEFRDEMVLFS